jgi:hypothetical protein
MVVHFTLLYSKTDCILVLQYFSAKYSNAKSSDALERKDEWEGIRKTSRSCCLGYMDRGKSFSN